MALAGYLERCGEIALGFITAHYGQLPYPTDYFGPNHAEKMQSEPSSIHPVSLPAFPPSPRRLSEVPQDHH
jgi:hypothetical protein